MQKEQTSAESIDPIELEHRASNEAEPCANAERVEKKQLLRKAILRLTESERDVLALAYVQALPSQDAAKLIGCEPGAFRVRLSRARNRLTELLENT